MQAPTLDSQPERVTLHVVVSQEEGTPVKIPIYHNPYYGDPQKGNLILGIPPVGFGVSRQSLKLCPGLAL